MACHIASLRWESLKYYLLLFLPNLACPYSLMIGKWMKFEGGSEAGITNKVIELEGNVALKPELLTGWSAACWIACKFAAL